MERQGIIEMTKKLTNSKFRCPKCFDVIYGWKNASKHAKEKKHWGDYNIKKDKE